MLFNRRQCGIDPWTCFVYGSRRGRRLCFNRLEYICVDLTCVDKSHRTYIFKQSLIFVRAHDCLRVLHASISLPACLHTVDWAVQLPLPTRHHIDAPNIISVCVWVSCPVVFLFFSLALSLCSFLRHPSLSSLFPSSSFFFPSHPLSSITTSFSPQKVIKATPPTSPSRQPGLGIIHPFPLLPSPFIARLHDTIPHHGRSTPHSFPRTCPGTHL